MAPMMSQNGDPNAHSVDELIKKTRKKRLPEEG